MSVRLPALRWLEMRCRGPSVTCLLPATSSDEWNKSLRPHPVLRLSFQSVFSRCLRWSSSLFASTSLFPPEPRGKDSRFLRCRVRGRKESSGRRGGGAVLNILLGRTAATPQTGFRVACTLKYSSGGEGGGMVGLGGGGGGGGVLVGGGRIEVAERRRRRGGNKTKCLRWNQSCGESSRSEMVQRAEEGEEQREAAEE